MRGADDGNGTGGLRSNLGGHAAEQLAQQGTLTRADQDVIDAVDLRKFKNGCGGIDRLDHMHGEMGVRKLQRLGPVLESDQTVDLLVVAMLIEREIECDPALFQHVETSKPC